MRGLFRATARGLVAAALAVAACVTIPVFAETSAQVTLGLKWLGDQVRPDGGLTGDTLSIATPMQARSEAARTLKLSGPLPPVLIDSVASEPDLNTEFLARQVLTLRSAGRDVNAKVAALLALQNEDGGFGGGLDYVSNPLDTSFALAALRAAGRTDAPVSRAEDYLLLLQSSEGAFAFDDGAANIQLTALVSSALQSGLIGTRLNAAVARANTWLLSMQHADGSWGGVTDTSLVQLAIVGTTSDSALQNIISGSILSHQDDDGSWAQDPYVTSIALRALMARTGQVANGSEGSIVGKVTARAGGAPIAGATAKLTNGGATAVSDAAGAIAFAVVAPGGNSVTVSAPGYTARRIAVDVKTGMISDIGVVALDRSVTGTLLGTVTDAVSKLPIAGALISVSGAANTTVYTLPDGSYELSGLIPGAIHIAASKPGYATTQADGSVAGGAVLQFSPGLAMMTNTATLKGRIVDETTALPLAGVTVFAGPGLSAVSAADGRFILAGIAGEKINVALSFPQYATKSFSFLVSAGVDVDVQTITLSKEAPPTTTTTIQGVVRDAASGAPIQGATVTTGGSAVLSAVSAADGTYRIASVPVGAITLSAVKSGYITQTASANGTVGVTIIFSPRLDTTIVPGIAGVVVDSVTMAPLAGVTATLTGNLDATRTAVSDAGGRYWFPDGAGTQLALALSLPGYESYHQLVNAGPGLRTEIPVTKLAKTSNLLVVDGKVTDLTTGKGIAKATVLILGTRHSAIADADGYYKTPTIAIARRSSASTHRQPGARRTGPGAGGAGTSRPRCHPSTPA